MYTNFFNSSDAIGEMAVVVGPDAIKGLAVAVELRRNNIISENFAGDKKLRKQLATANGIENLQCCVFVFDDEIKVKDMWTGNEKVVERDQVIGQVLEVFKNGYYEKPYTNV